MGLRVTSIMLNFTASVAALVLLLNKQRENIGDYLFNYFVTEDATFIITEDNLYIEVEDSTL